jgi:hypothetical protein
MISFLKFHRVESLINVAYLSRLLLSSLLEWPALSPWLELLVGAHR